MEQVEYDGRMLSIPPVYVGMLAGLTTSLLWTATSLFFTAAGRRLGPTRVNFVRILMAIVLLGVTHRLLAGAWWPGANGVQVFLLALSGIVGLAIGDQALFTAFVQIGPRLSMLIMTTSPLMAALFGWVALGETLGTLAWIGIVLTVAGVGWVVLERPRASAAVSRSKSPRRATGMLLALTGAACQAGGLMLSKAGIGHGWLPADEHLDPQAATLIRMVFAAVGMVPILVLNGAREARRRQRGVGSTYGGSRLAGYAFAAGGAVVGPFLGVWMSLVAAHHASLGVAQTLCSLTPLFILPFATLAFDERISPRAILGALVAVAGVSLLFVQPS